MNVLGWLWFFVVQTLMTLFMIFGWVLLIPFCLAHAWKMSAYDSIKDGRVIDTWSWGPLNWIYGNPEDGVSGLQALVWNAAGTLQGPYMPQRWHVSWDGTRYQIVWQMWLYDAWRAYCWSAWRNSCDNMKYLLAWSQGPQTTILGYKVRWWLENGKKVPLL